MKKILIAIVLAAFAANVVLPLAAAEDKAVEKKAGPTARAIPFRGKIGAVDKQAKTIQVGERTFQIMADTRIMKAGKPASLDDAATGEEVGGAYREGENKKLNVVSLRIGPRPDAAPKQDDKKN